MKKIDGELDMDNKIYLVLDYMVQHYKKANFNCIWNKFNDILFLKNIKIVKAFKYDKPLVE